jgi:hypothetical protein
MYVDRIPALRIGTLEITSSMIQGGSKCQGTKIDRHRKTDI